MQEDKEKSLNYSSKKVEIIGIYYLYVVKVTNLQRFITTFNQHFRVYFGRIELRTYRAYASLAHESGWFRTNPNDIR